MRRAVSSNSYGMRTIPWAARSVSAAAETAAEARLRVSGCSHGRDDLSGCVFGAGVNIFRVFTPACGESKRVNFPPPGERTACSRRWVDQFQLSCRLPQLPRTTPRYSQLGSYSSWFLHCARARVARRVVTGHGRRQGDEPGGKDEVQRRWWCEEDSGREPEEGDLYGSTMGRRPRRGLVHISSISCELFLACVFVSSRDAPTLAITTTGLKLFFFFEFLSSFTRRFTHPPTPFFTKMCSETCKC